MIAIAVQIMPSRSLHLGNGGQMAVVQGTFIFWGELPKPRPPGLSIKARTHKNFGTLRWLPMRGVTFLPNGSMRPSWYGQTILPLWIPTLLFITLFLSGRPLRFHRGRKRKKLGLCVKCGYDLRASKDRCPECGTEIEKQ